MSGTRSIGKAYNEENTLSKCRVNVIMYLLLDRLMLNGEDALSFLSKTGSTTFTDSFVLDATSLHLV